MDRAVAGVIWALAFIVLEAVQYVFFGGLFQRMSSVLFGFLVFGITTVAFVGWAATRAPRQLANAFANPGPLIGVNITATLAWGAYLTSVQLIEPAVAYTIGAGAMPLTAYAAYLCGVREGGRMRNRTEALGNILVLCGILYLAVITVFGWSGFVRGDLGVAVAGVLLAVADGVLFTWMLIYCQRMDRCGVGPAAVFGLRFVLYAAVAGGLVAYGVEQRETLPVAEIAVIVVIGLALTAPPLFALQKAVASISTMTISALTALGPFLIFGMQMIEGRVDYSQVTLTGLTVYFAGAMLAALGAVRATARKPAAGG